ncbi:MAG: GIY-YIG nuclease family protein [Candidatus Omnitrophota bacterium]
MCWLYIVENTVINKFYIGVTKEVQRRVKEHNGKCAKKWATRQKGEWTLVYSEKFRDKKTALLREKEIKKKKSREYIKKLINNMGPSISLV